MSSSEEFALHTSASQSAGPASAGWRRLFRRPKNRRLDRKQLLDVKIRSSQRRRDQWRRLTMLGLTAACVVLGLVGIWRGAEYLGRLWFTANPAFAIHNLEVQTDGVIALEQIRSWAGVKLNDNLFALDLSRIKRDLECVPMIESALIQRIPPHTLRIVVTERQPVAQVRLPASESQTNPLRYWLDAKGYVMYPLEGFQLSNPALTNRQLPWLDGVPLNVLRFGQVVDLPGVQAALQLIQAFERSPMLGLVSIEQIDVSKAGLLHARTTQGTEVIFGLQDFARQLRRWRAIHDYGLSTGRHLAWVDLSVTNNVPARWADAGPPVIPSPAHPLQPKKPHA
jgi:cell division septal protein FtsQ